MLLRRPVLHCTWKQLSRGCAGWRAPGPRGVAVLSDTDVTSLVGKPEAQGHQRLSLLPGPASVQSPNKPIPLPRYFPVHPGHSLPQVHPQGLPASIPCPHLLAHSVQCCRTILLKGKSPITPRPQAFNGPSVASNESPGLRTWLPPSSPPQGTHLKPWGPAISVPSTNCAISAIHVLV